MSFQAPGTAVIATILRLKNDCHWPLNACQVPVMLCSATNSGVITQPTLTSSPTASPLTSPTSTSNEPSAPSLTSAWSAPRITAPWIQMWPRSPMPAKRVKKILLTPSPAPRITTRDAATSRVPSQR